MDLLLFAIAAGIVSGVIAGILPGIGNTVIILTMVPVLFKLPPEISIIYYAVCLQAGNFASTVSSINLGLLGDITGEPALRERETIIRNGLTVISLKFSAVSSVISAVLAAVMLYGILSIIGTTEIILRTETKMIFLLLIVTMLLFWPKNNWVTNLILTVIGFCLGLIGHHEQFLMFQDVHILTGGFTELYQGIPTIVILSSFIAVPAILKLFKIDSFVINNDSLTREFKFPILSCLRGVGIGSVIGTLPMIGTMFSSNIAWYIERIFNKQNSVTDSLSRLAAAESANNSSSIIVLVPLLTVGLAIIPSEMILLSVLETKLWIPNLSSWQLLSIDFYQWLVLSIIISGIASYFICYTYVKLLSEIIAKNFKTITRVSIIIIVTSIVYVGWTVDNIVYYLLVFFLFVMLTSINRTIEYIPLVTGYLLIDEIINSIRVILNLYY